MVEPLNTKAWVLVPVEPTEEMFRACWPLHHPWGANAPSPEERPALFEDMVSVVGGFWKAMLSASPALPAVDGGEIAGKLLSEADWLDKTYGDGSETGKLCRSAAALISSQKQNLYLLRNSNTSLADNLEAAESRVQSLEEEVKRLREALEPFADYIAARDANDHDYPDETSLMAYASEFRGEPVRVTFGQFRAARAALKETGQ